MSRFLPKSLIHVVLLCGVLVFLFPFLWMAGLSLKTDEEATSGTLFPAPPAFRAESPYLRPAVSVDAPRSAALDAKRWPPLRENLLALSSRAVESVPTPVGFAGQRQELNDRAAALLTAHLVAKLSEAVWEKDDDVLAAYSAVMTPEAANAAVAEQTSQLLIKSVEIRLLDRESASGVVAGVGTGVVTGGAAAKPTTNAADGKQNLFKLCKAQDVATFFTVESGPAELVPNGGDGAVLAYHFANASDAPVVLKAEFDFPTDDVQRLHKVFISTVNDDSWHRVDFSMQVGSALFTSTRGNYIAQHRAGSFIFQPPTFDDTTPRAKTWTPLKVSNIDPPLPGRRAVMRVVISPSGTTTAIAAKAARNFLTVFRSVPFWRYVFNSVVLVALQVAGALFSTSFVAYAFARLRWPGRGVAFGLLLATMMLPSQVTMIPGFLIWRGLGWYNTLNPLWIGAWCGSAFFVFLMVQNMKTIPKELDEAARIDGLNAVQTWYYVIVPQVKPTMAAIAIMTFMAAWNDFMGPLVMLRDQALFPLSLGLFSMRVDQGPDWGTLMAANCLMTLPVVLIFFLFQRQFIQGVTATGMKG